MTVYHYIIKMHRHIGVRTVGSMWIGMLVA